MIKPSFKITFWRLFILAVLFGTAGLSLVAQATCIGGCGGYTYFWGTGSWGACTGGSGSWSYSAWSPSTGGYCTSSLYQTRSAYCNINANSGTQTRSVTCMNISTGKPAPNFYCRTTAPSSVESCTPTSTSICGAEAPTSTTTSDYSGCGYNWITGGWSGPSSSCSSSATETRSVQCQRSDGTIVSNSACNASTEPPSTQTVSSYSGCSYSWSYGSWGSCTGGSGSWNYSAWSPAAGSYCTSSLSQSRTASCVANSGSGSQSRSATCVRSDGTPVASSYCSTSSEQATSESCTPTSGYSCGTEGSLTNSVADYGGCSYSWVTSAWSAPSSTCSTSATETRTVSCQRSDGTTVASSYCTASTEPSSSQTLSVTSGCSYTWSSGSWGSCTGGSGNWTYTPWSPASGTYCTSKLDQTRTGSCDITAGSGSQTRTVTCQRSDGTTVASSYCTATEPAASQSCTPTSVNCGTEAALSQTVSDYGGCTYSWQASGFGACIGGSGTWSYTAWTPTCGSGTFTQTRSGTCNPNTGSATQTQTVSCQRSDGTTVADTYCSISTEPPLSQACTPSSGYSCGTEAPLSQSVTMNTVCMAAMTSCVPDPAKGIYCVTVPLN